MADASYQTIGPTSMDHITDMKVSPNGQRVAIAGVRNVVEVFEYVDGAWVLFYTFASRSKTMARPVARILWHPWNPYEMIIGLNDGTGVVASFEDQAGEKFGTIQPIKTIDFRRIFQPANINWETVAVNEDATEMAGTINNDNEIFAWKDPFSEAFRGVQVFTCIPERFQVDLDHKALASAYISRSLVVFVYPLGFIAISTIKQKIKWRVDVKDAEAMSAACISPRKDVLVGLTVYGEAYLYSLENGALSRKLRTYVEEPFRPLKSCIFYDQDLIAFTFAETSAFLFMPIFQPGNSKVVRLARSRSRSWDPDTSVKIYHAGTIMGKGHILLTTPNQNVSPLSKVTLVIPGTFDPCEVDSDEEIDEEPQALIGAVPAREEGHDFTKIAGILNIAVLLALILFYVYSLAFGAE